MTYDAASNDPEMRLRTPFGLFKWFGRNILHVVRSEYVLEVVSLLCGDACFEIFLISFYIPSGIEISENKTELRVVTSQTEQLT